MANHTQQEAIKEIDKIAKENGFIMREQNANYGGAKLYKFEDRETGRIFISNMLFWVAYENALHCETWL